MPEAATPELEPGKTPEAAATPEPEPKPEASATSDEPKAEKPRKTGFEKRIDVLTARNSEYQRENEDLRRQLEERQKPADSAASSAERPAYEDFDSEEAYLDALTEWKVDQRLQQADAKRQAEQREAKAKAQQDDAARALQQMVARGSDKHDDFDAVFLNQPDLSVTQPMLEAIIASDSGEEVAYHLGKNPSEADRISELSPVQQAIEIGRLGERLANVQTATSKAPEPVTPVDDTSAGASDPLSDRASIKDWMKARNKQVQAR